MSETMQVGPHELPDAGLADMLLEAVRRRASLFNLELAMEPFCSRARVRALVERLEAEGKITVVETAVSVGNGILDFAVSIRRGPSGTKHPRGVLAHIIDRCVLLMIRDHRPRTDDGLLLAWFEAYRCYPCRVKRLQELFGPYFTPDEVLAAVARQVLAGRASLHPEIGHPERPTSSALDIGPTLDIRVDPIPARHEPPTPAARMREAVVGGLERHSVSDFISGGRADR
jgi:hypothetical protein